MKRTKPEDIDALRARRVAIRHEIRSHQNALQAFEIPDKPWARAWRARHAKRTLELLTRAKRELEKLDRVLGPPPAVFKPRPLDAATARKLDKFRKADTTAGAW